MRIEKLILCVIIVLLILAASIVEAVFVDPKLQRPVANLATSDLSQTTGPVVQTGPTVQIMRPSINILAFYPAAAKPGNSERCAVEVNVTQYGEVCGLNMTNFRLGTIQVPPYGAEVVIHSVGAVVPPIGVESVPCNYTINMVPTTYQGTQYTWVEGTYSVKLSFIRNGVEQASRTLNFTIGSDQAGINVFPINETPSAGWSNLP